MTTIQMMPATVTHRLVVARLSAPDQQEAVRAGDLGEVCHHDHVGGEDAPAAHPAGTTAPNARAAQVNVVPQSGSASFSSL